MHSRQMGSSAQFLRGTAVPAPQGVGSSAEFLRGIMVPAVQAFKTDGFERQIFTRGGGSSAPRRQFQRPILTRGRSSSGSCLQDRWVPAFIFCEGRWLQQATAWVPTLHCDRAACRLADLPTFRFADLASCRFANLPTCRLAGLLTCRPASCRPAELPTCRPAGLPTWRPADLPTCRLADLPTCQLADGGDGGKLAHLVRTFTTKLFTELASQVNIVRSEILKRICTYRSVMGHVSRLDHHCIRSPFGPGGAT